MIQYGTGASFSTGFYNYFLVLPAYFGCSTISGNTTLMQLWHCDFLQVVSNESGVLAAIKPGKSFVDMSSVEVDAAMDLYEVSNKYFTTIAVSDMWPVALRDIY